MAAPLLIAKTGDTLETIQQTHGDYDWMFSRFIDALPVEVVQAHRQPELLPDPKDVSGVIITGSPHSVTRPEAWTHALADWTRAAVEAGTPTLGVCYGHQLLAMALGGRVERNVGHFSLGTIEVRLTAAGEEDKLLGPLRSDGPMYFNAVYGDHVTELPADAILLAENDTSPVQAFAVGEHVRAVQFHPEFSRDFMPAYVQGRGHLLRADAERRGADPEAAMQDAQSGLRDTPLGPRLLKRWVDEFVLRPAGGQP